MWIVSCFFNDINIEICFKFHWLSANKPKKREATKKNNNDIQLDDLHRQSNCALLNTNKNNTKYYELALSECVWVCVRTRVIYCNCFICIVIIFVSFEQTLDTKRYTWQLFIVTLQSTIPQFRLCGWVRACAHRGKMMIQNVRTNKKQMPLQRWFFLQYSLLHHFLINRKKKKQTIWTHRNVHSAITEKLAEEAVSLWRLIVWWKQRNESQIGSLHVSWPFDLTRKFQGAKNLNQSPIKMNSI